MAVDQETVKRVAFLSRLKVDEDKIPATENEFNKILKWVEQRTRLTRIMSNRWFRLMKILWSAATMFVNDGEMPDKILANAPQSEFGYFVVPKVVE